jgi:hypothetical protein
MWSALPEIQRHIVTLRYSPSYNTPPAATVAVTTGGGATNLQKYSFWFAIHGRSNTPPVVTATVAAVQWDNRHMGCNRMSEHTSEFLVAHSTSKKTFLGPKHCNWFFEI